MLNLFRSAPRRLIDKTAPFVAVAALRAKNRVLHALEEAIFALEGCGVSVSGRPARGRM